MKYYDLSEVQKVIVNDMEKRYVARTPLIKNKDLITSLAFLINKYKYKGEINECKQNIN